MAIVGAVQMGVRIVSYKMSTKSGILLSFLFLTRLFCLFSDVPAAVVATRWSNQIGQNYGCHEPLSNSRFDWFICLFIYINTFRAIGITEASGVSKQQQKQTCILEAKQFNYST